MDYYLSAHAGKEIDRRQIPLSLLEMTLSRPEQIVRGHDEIQCYQSRFILQEKRYLLRVMVSTKTYPPTVVTAYRTSKISKYWNIP
jgi:hypothetical protein